MKRVWKVEAYHNGKWHERATFKSRGDAEKYYREYIRYADLYIRAVMVEDYEYELMED